MKIQQKQIIKKVLIALLVIIAVPILYSYWLVPFLWIYREYNPVKTSFMKYRAKQAIAKGYRVNPRYSFVPVEDISPALIRAVIIAEDCNFYSHRGLDVAAINRSLQLNKRRKKIVQGGSTITMQLCKNLFLSPKKNYSRKIIEAILAIRIEHNLSKKRIIELYLNLIEWGPGIYGVENASHFYFSKSAKDLDDQESAFLASIIMNPIAYQHEKSRPQFDQRRAWILNYMKTGEYTVPSTNIIIKDIQVTEFEYPTASIETYDITASENIGQAPTLNLNMNSDQFSGLEKINLIPTSSLKDNL